MDKNVIEFEMLHRYLNSGLVPVAGFSLEQVQSFQSMLESLSLEERRISKRKFRKKWRKLLKTLPAEVVGGLTEESVGSLAGARRRRAVHRHMLRQVVNEKDIGG
jgi:hypothetical protein